MPKKSPEDGAAPRKAPARKAASKKDAAAEKALPAFDSLDEKALRRLAAKLSKNPKIDNYKVSKIVRDANGDSYSAVTPILWHLIEHGALAAEGMPGVLHEINEKPALGSPETIFGMLVRMGPCLGQIGDWLSYVPGVPLFVDALIVSGWEQGSALFESRSAELDPRLRLYLAFVRGRFERPVDPADGAAILDHLARQLANGNLTHNSALRMSSDGQVIEHRMQDEAAALVVAKRFGAEEDFYRSAIKHALSAEEPAIRSLGPTLRRAPIGDVAEVLARRFSWGDSDSCEQELALLESRNDSAEELWAAALELVPGKTRGKYDRSPDDENGPARQRLAVRDNLLALAAVRFAAAGKAVPDSFEELYSFEALSDVYHPTIRRHVAAFAALPRERALALADRRMVNDYGYSPASAVLAAHKDAARLRKLLEKDRPNGYLGARYLGLHGAEIVPLLATEMDQVSQSAKRSRHEAILHALTTAARQGATADPAWTQYFHWDSNGTEALKYWSGSDGVMRDDALDAFAPEVRRALLLKAAAEEAYPARVLTSRHAAAEDRALVTAIVDQIVKREGSRANRDQLSTIYSRLGAVFVEALCDSIARLGTDAAFLELLRGPLSHQDHQRLLASVQGKVESIRDLFLRQAAATSGPKSRVYALDRDGEKGFSAREGSFSRIGGSVPGLAEESYPKWRGDAMTPILTFDLDEIPELQKRHPNARLLVLFHPDPEGGENQEDACLVAVPRAAVTEAGDGEPLAVTAIDLPDGVFAERGSAERDRVEIADLRKQLFRRGGHVFGSPFWIQGEDDDVTGDFLFQLNDGLCDLNLGDVGSFYAFDDGTFLFQCH